MKIAIIGAGFAGIGLGIRLKQTGENDFVILERADGIGGTWRDNVYPGCQCDVPSNLYSFSFMPNPHWTRTFPTQPEILDYLHRCVERFGLKSHIRLGAEVQRADWDEKKHVWHINTAAGEFEARYLASGQGGLSEPRWPEIPGLETFNGPKLHSAKWDYGHDLTGKRIALIGTGASAIQILPRIQPDAEAIHLYQRTPAWIVPHRDRPVSSWERALFRTIPLTQRAIRGTIYWLRELMAIGFTRRPRLLKAAERLSLRHLERQVADPELRRKLTPNYAMGCKRVLISNEFYPAVTAANTELITGGIKTVTAHGIVDNDAVEREVDAIICATGFHVTDSPIASRIHGAGGTSLAQRWQPGMQAYRGTTVDGFPNLFLLTGPNTGLGHTSMIVMMEAQFSYILSCLSQAKRRGWTRLEAIAQRVAAYNAQLQNQMGTTVWMSGCSSWYLDANGRNTTLWPDFTWRYRRQLQTFDAWAYITQSLKTTDDQTSSEDAELELATA